MLDPTYWPRWSVSFPSEQKKVGKQSLAAWDSDRGFHNLPGRLEATAKNSPSSHVHILHVRARGKHKLPAIRPLHSNFIGLRLAENP